MRIYGALCRQKTFVGGAKVNICFCVMTKIY